MQSLDSARATSLGGRQHSIDSQMPLTIDAITELDGASSLSFSTAHDHHIPYLCHKYYCHVLSSFIPCQFGAPGTLSGGGGASKIYVSVILLLSCSELLILANSVLCDLNVAGRATTNLSRWGA